jgi:diguanylate cyclase (GGDEF)-like protein
MASAPDPSAEENVGADHADYESSFLERAYRALLAENGFDHHLRDLADTARTYTACERVVIERAGLLDPNAEPIDAVHGRWTSREESTLEADLSPSLQMPVITDGVAAHVMTFFKGTTPGRFSPSELEHVRRFADLAGLILAGAARAEVVGRLMHVEDGPAVASRNDFEDEVSSALASHDGQAGFMIVRIDDLNEVNQRHGREVGDEVLRLVARSLRETVGPLGTVGRVRRHEFAAVLPGESYGRTRELAAALDRAFENPLPVLGRDDVSAAIAVGVAAATSGASDSVAPLFHAAYSALERELRTPKQRGSRWLIP